MIQNNHELYRKLLNEYKIEKNEGILWGQVLYTRIWKSFENNIFQSLICAIKSILFSTYELKFSYLGNRVLLIRNCNNRNDHNKIWENLKLCTGEYDFIELQRNPKIDNRIICNIKKIVKIIKSMPYEIKLKDRLYLSSWIMQIMRIQECDLNELKDTRMAIFFFDGDPIENFICQKIKLILPSCVTSTIQHGQYVYKKQDYDINQTGILNFTADYIFTWGEFTKEQFIKSGVCNKRIIKSGNLLNPININNTSVDIFYRKKVFGVICDAPSYNFARDKNNEMIDLANKLANMFDLQFWIKLHPFDSENNYNINHNLNKCIGFYSKEKLMSNFVEDIDFALLHVSSSYIDLLILNCKSFKYNSEVYYPIVDNEEDTFNNCDELAEKYEIWNRKSNEEKLEYLLKNKSRYIEPVNTLERYKDLIENLTL